MWFAFGFISIAFHIFLIFSGLVPNLISRPIHMALILPWIFLYNKTLSDSEFGAEYGPGVQQYKAAHESD